MVIDYFKKLFIRICYLNFKIMFVLVDDFMVVLELIEGIERFIKFVVKLCKCFVGSFKVVIFRLVVW